MTKKKNKGGQPTSYKEEYDRLAYVACSEGGFTDLKLAKLFSVCKATITNWKREHPKFLASIIKGKDEFNSAMAEDSLLKRVKGFSYNEATKKRIPIRDEDGEITGYQMETVKSVRKYVPPDQRSVEFFLKNRNPERWRNELDVNIKDESEIQTPDEVLRRLAFMLRNREEELKG
jgi:hypothetical protein